MSGKTMEEIKREGWFLDLNEEKQYIFELIFKYHKYFSGQDKKYRYIVKALRLLVLVLTSVNTIILGVKNYISVDKQILFGLILSACITFFTAVMSYFNYEEYWMRNIAIHIDLNVLRDNFIYDAKAGKLKQEGTADKYREELENLQKRNIDYWQRALKRIG